MPTLESKNEEEPMPHRHTTSMFPGTARPSRARWQRWQRWVAAGLLAAGFGGHAAVHAADAEEMWIGGASRQAVARKTALGKPRYRALHSS